MNHEAVETVLVIDDHPLFRKGVSQLLGLDPGFTMVGEATSGTEGLALAQELRPDLILLDLNMKDMNGIETLKGLRAAELDARIIVLTVSDSAEDLVAAPRAGADGYLLKDMEPEHLLEGLREAAAGRMVLSDTLTGVLAHALRQDSRPARPDQAGLTERESEILQLVAAGMSNKLIGRHLDITEGTVKVHVKNLLKKLNLRSRVEAAVWAVEHGYTER
jgi:two-component system, NarL family, nitrate/nitrite response regulator NarL